MVKVGRHRPGGRALALVHVPDAVRVLEGDDGLIGAGNPIAYPTDRAFINAEISALLKR